MSLSHKITTYLGRTPDFVNEVILQDDGDGAYIKEWNVEDKEKPSDVKLDTFEVEAQKLVDDNLIIENRRLEYPPMEDQLDYMFHNGFDKWKEDIVQPVKDKYPKPE